MDNLESICKIIHESIKDDGGDQWAQRLATARVFGNYADAKFMRYMHETHGLNIADQIIYFLQSTDLKIPWEGLRDEFLMMGMSESSVKSMLNEAREFEKFATASQTMRASAI